MRDAWHSPQQIWDGIGHYVRRADRKQHRAHQPRQKHRHDHAGTGENESRTDHFGWRRSLVLSHEALGSSREKTKHALMLRIEADRRWQSVGGIYTLFLDNVIVQTNVVDA